MIKNNGKVNKPTMTMDSAILISCCLLKKKELLPNEYGQVKSLTKCDTLDGAQPWSSAQMVTVQTNNPNHHHSKLYIFLSFFFSFSVSFDHSLLLYFYLYFIYFLNC